MDQLVKMRKVIGCGAAWMEKTSTGDKGEVLGEEEEPQEWSKELATWEEWNDDAIVNCSQYV